MADTLTQHPQVNTIAEIPNSGLKFSGSREVPNNSGAGGSGTLGNSDLQNLVLTCRNNSRKRTST